MSKNLVIAALFVLSQSAHAGPDVIEPYLGYSNGSYFGVDEYLEGSAGGILPIDSEHDAEVLLAARYGGHAIGAAWGMYLWVAKVKLEAGMDPSGTSLPTATVDIQPFGVTLWGMLDATAGPIEITRETRIGRELSVSIDAVSARLKLPIAGNDSAVQLVAYLAVQAAGLRIEDYTNSPTFVGFEIADGDAGLQLLINESFLMPYPSRGVSAAISAGASASAAIGESKGDATAWFSEQEIYADVRVSLSELVSVFARGRLRRIEDTGNDEITRSSELIGGVRLRF